MSSGFNNPIIGGGGALVYPSIHSPNYQTGVQGWTINKNGNAEFDNLTLRGTFNGNDYVINSSGFFLYSPSEGAGNLTASIAATPGTDLYGNTYPGGLGLSGGYGADVLLYAPAALTVVQYLSGAGNWPAPSNLVGGTLRAECWGAGASGVGSSAGGSNGAAGGSGEYAAELTLAVTAANSYAYSVGVGGAPVTGLVNGNAGTASTFTGNSVTVTANPGHGGITSGSGGAPGTGSTNTYHANGAGGGPGSAGIAGQEPGGGASSAGSGSTFGSPVPGNAGGEGTTGATVPGGGPGGAPGSSGSAGSAPITGPGGGGGGAAVPASGSNASGAGATGQIRLTYKITSTTPALIAALAAIAGSDPVTAASYAAGYTGPVTAFQPHSNPQVPETWHNIPLSGWTSSPFPALYRVTANGDVELAGRIVTGGTSSTISTALPVGYYQTTYSLTEAAIAVLTSGGITANQTPRIALSNVGVLSVGGVTVNNGTTLLLDGVVLPISAGTVS